MSASEPTPELRRLGAQLTPTAREHIDANLDAIRSFVPTLGLLYGNNHAAADSAGSWSVIAYSDENVQELVDFYGQFGAAVCFELDGYKVVVPQIGQLQQLESGLVDMRDNRLWHQS